MFKCTDCQKVVRRVEDIRNCSRCQSRGIGSSIPANHNDTDWLTPAIIGYALGGGFSSHSHSTPAEDTTPAFSGGGGDTVGAGAGGSWSDDSDRSSGSSDSSSSDSSSSDSGSSDSGGGGSSD